MNMQPVKKGIPTASLQQAAIATLALFAIAIHLGLRFGTLVSPRTAELPLLLALVLGGIPLVWGLLVKLWNREFGSDLLAGISIVTSVLLGEFLAGTLVVLMLSGGEALEAYAVRSASSVLQALAKRIPSVAHRRVDSRLEEIELESIKIGDTLIVLPHEICPVDGTVLEGRGVMDESYLTGEPYMMSKTPGAQVLSGAINGESGLTIRADKLAIDSRFARIMNVMRGSAQKRPHMRRLGDQLGAFYTPLAVALGAIAWVATGDPVRFLAVMVVATPCPLLIAIPVAIIGSISLAAKRAIIIRDPMLLERVASCRVMIFDKTGTLTYGTPALVEQVHAEGIDPIELLSLVASLERYSKHPLAKAVVARGTEIGVFLHEVSEMSERPGRGLTGIVAGQKILVTSRRQLLQEQPALAGLLPPPTGGLECLITWNGTYAATYQFRDAPRKEGMKFINHLKPLHRIEKIMLLSGDRESEVQYLAEQVGISELHASKSPEEKLEIVRRETARAPTLFMGDGINDAPALMAATVGIAFGQNSDVTAEAAGAVILESSLGKVDELFHIGARMRAIALQSAIGGMGLSVVGMLFAASGWLPPVAGAICQEMIDVVAVLNALRAAFPPKSLTDF